MTYEVFVVVMGSQGGQEHSFSVYSDSPIPAPELNEFMWAEDYSCAVEQRIFTFEQESAERGNEEDLCKITLVCRQVPRPNR